LLAIGGFATDLHSSLRDSLHPPLTKGTQIGALAFKAGIGLQRQGDSFWQGLGGGGAGNKRHNGKR
jgi:hypothetical protein